MKIELLPLADVERIVGRKKSSIYADPHFPKPVKVGRNNRWVSSEIEDYVSRLIAARDAGVMLQAKLKSMHTEAEFIKLFKLWRCEKCKRLLAPVQKFCPFCPRAEDDKVSPIPATPTLSDL